MLRLDSEMRRDAIEMCKRQTPATLTEWWIQLNQWEWPAELPEPESPIRFNVIGVRESRRYAIMRWIKKAVGERQILRRVNSEKTDAEFEEFLIARNSPRRRPA